ncbi:hypothetical protein UFOVP2_20 [uncultured Caudovirales phage]|uniref:Uncharacterized protein n=1 Tax=uncultured Caudovirales phage TaxID=2100421 RepID=A0A6J5KI63_9CAUD|nr:hypothetical protein UFOVP2_20 [uncultured Caudovirales phage]
MLSNNTTRKPLAYNIALARIKEEQQRLQRQAEWLKAHQKHINAIAKRFEKLPEGTLTYGPSFSISQGYEDISLTMSATMSNIEGFKCEQLKSVLELFIDADETSSTDWAEYLNRDFRFTFKIADSKDTIMVNIAAYAKPDSPTCQKILKEVKTTTREVNVYEMVCTE